jgi:hypothetical protein
LDSGKQGTREAILALTLVIEKRMWKEMPTYVAFVDLQKAFEY